MKSDAVLSMLGLCKKAGGLKSGAYSVEEAVKNHKAALVVVTADASERTKKSHRDMCAYYQVPLFEYGTKESLSAAIGAENRVSVVITDQNFADELVKRLSKQQ